MNSRRSFLRNTGLGLTASAITPLASVAVRTNDIAPSVKKGIVVKGIDLHVVKVNQRGNWYFVELKSSSGISGFGECSHAFGKNQADGDLQVRESLKAFFELVKDESPFDVEKYRQRGFAKADNKLKRTVFSGIEQALWDLGGKALGIPAYQFFGGKVRDELRVYANINRATNDRDSNGRRPVSSFQKNAEEAMKQGFTAFKLAPFDEMKPLYGSSEKQVEADIAHAISCIEGVRTTIGTERDLLIDVHSHLNVDLAVKTAARIRSSDLYWFEEPVDPATMPAETREIRQSIRQTLAGGEAIFGRSGYANLIHDHALGIIMPDIKHCGGLLEARYIAAMAETAGNIQVAPHNPSGPVATAASVAVCATITNFSILEYAFGEVPWRNDLVTPGEQFAKGFLHVSDLPGIGIILNKKFINAHK